MATSVGVVLFAITAALADSTREAYYRDCIDARIEKCEQLATHAGSRGPNLQAASAEAMEQARFYRESKEALVRRMHEEAVPQKDYKIDHFLIESYTSR